MKQALRYALVVGGAIVSILLFLLASASDNSGFFDRYYSWLLGLNAAVAGALLILVLVLLARLYSRYKSGKFGSRLMTRLMLWFAAIGILPGLVIFMVSVQFVSHSIESWFNVRIETALESGLNLGHAALDEALGDLTLTVKQAAPALAPLMPPASHPALRELLKAREGVQSAMLLDAGGKLIDSAHADAAAIPGQDLPTFDMLTQAAEPGGYARAEGGIERDLQADPHGAALTALDAATGLRLRVILPLPRTSGADVRYLQLLQSVPANLATNAEVIRAAYSEYQERHVARVGLRKMYIETLTLTLLLAIFGAIGSAFLIAGNLAQPLLVLAEGTRAVAEGDLSPRPIVATSDELGTLTQSFNAMTRQLFEARSAVERNRAALQSAKAHLESVLENMSAGVIVLDADFHIVNSNEAGERILQQDLAAATGKPLTGVEGLELFASAITRGFSAQSAQSAADNGRLRTHWQQQIEVPRRFGSTDDHDITLLARGSRLPVGAGSGFIVVFDDISDVISAQRSVAWGEVARRLAHEIKNPLTPIQLSAERLQMKLEGRLAPEDAELLERGTSTIVSQVDAMKRMVDDFRDYAKAPPAVLNPLDLNALIGEILQLYLSGDESDIIHVALAPNLPQVMGDATQLRQVVHNLLQNAQDAMIDRAPGRDAPRIDVRTEAIHYQNPNGAFGTAVRLSITDNGPGFSPRILARAFEPYVTSKARGTSTIVSQVDAMKRMVDDFRDYAKAPPAVLEPLDLNALITEILQLYLSGDESDIIHVALAPNLPEVMGDATQLRQVVHNLLQNAQDAMIERGERDNPRIDVRTEAIHYQNPDGAFGTAVRFSVTDNGPGFAPRILSRAFEPYVTSKARGTGLGLPMVKKIIDEHGGKIDIGNLPGGSGAAVSILLLKLGPAANLAPGQDRA